MIVSPRLERPRGARCSQTPEDGILDLQTHTLSNGLTVASVRLPGFRTAAIGAYVRVGSRHEPAGLNGISHFLEHMAFKGTELRDARRISFEAEMVGATMNAYTAKDHTAYYMVLLAEHMRTALDVLSDVLMRSTFPADEIERERTVILQELGDAADDPQDLVQDHFDLKAFPGQPLGQPILGNPKVIRTVRRDDFVAYLQSHYTAANMVVVGVGGIEHRAFADMVAEHFGDLPAGSPSDAAPARYAGGYRNLDDDFGQASVALGWATPGRTDPRYPACELLGDLFGGGMSSPLFQAVRERRGLAYSLDSFTDGHEDCGIFQVTASVAPRNLRAFFDVVCEELVSLAQRVDPGDLERARNQHRANLLMAAERPQALAESVARDLLLHGRVVPLDEAAARIRDVDEAQLRDVLASLLGATPTLAIVGRAGRGDHYGLLSKRLRA
jgi:predicted Zn-dependent peptidase